MNKLLKPTLAAVACLAAAFAAYATVTFSGLPGCAGFVGNGDVQSPRGWNNQALNFNAGGVSFTYESSASYEGVCTWTTGEGTPGETTHNVTHTRSTSVNDTVQHETRKNRQNDVTGFILTGCGTTTEGGDAVPVLGGPCPGNPGTGAVYTSVTLLPGSTGGLYSHWNGDSIQLIWP